ncbi:PrpR N-terminal domain-containing protein [Fusibacter paucivorans]|uniref:PrpR N-terminal domain-containing protein n=1 Tax=Fusibacter paucivorans TaxID=76009 RepID=A0ABS5PM17_9FIRM|nr:PrpR N-terminal domain-containing protein [Fusibacter paucivorans]MBS7526223.1 PrpR N-terminal domain-containing protein [Fusibacter paucivorans]
MMNDIVLISPFDGLNAMAKKLIETVPYQDVEVVGGDLMQGVHEARKAVSRGAEVIISRGGTYSKILEIVNIPVVEIKLTAFDVFNSFKEIRHISAPIAIVGYENVIQGYDIIEDLLTVQNIVKLTLDDTESVDSQIKKLMAQGIEVFVGDTIVNSVAKKYGCKSYMIESGETAIANAIDEAIRILNAIKSDRERMKRYMAVIDNTSIVINLTSEITAAHSLRLRLFLFCQCIYFAS